LSAAAWPKPRPTWQCRNVVFDELSQGLRDIEYLADPATGQVRIGCPESLAENALWMGTPVPMRLDNLRPTYRAELLPTTSAA
jgi:hypothetical protein